MLEMLNYSTAQLVAEAINEQANYSFVSLDEIKWAKEVEAPRSNGYKVFALQKGPTTILFHPDKIGNETRYSVQFVNW